MATSSIEFTVTLELLDATMRGIQETREFLAGERELVTGEPLGDVLAAWLLPQLPQDVTTIAATIAVTPSPLDTPSGGGLGGGGQVGATGKALAQAGRKPPRPVSRGGSTKLGSSSK
jgi:hypothetical protein